jgi:hypothetical protein
MSWPGDIEEVLRVLAPELIFLALLVNSLTSASVGSPLTLELLLDGVWQLHQVNWVRGEHSKEEGSFLILLVLGTVRVRDHHVVHWLLVVLWSQPTSLRDLTLAKSLETLRGFQHDIGLVDLPKPISLRFDSDHKEIDWDVWPLAHFFVLLHQAENDIGLLCH